MKHREVTTKGVSFNVWLSLGEKPETHFQFLRSDDGAYALPGAVAIGHVLVGPTGLALWQPKPEWRDVPHINAAVMRQWKNFT